MKNRKNNGLYSTVIGFGIAFLVFAVLVGWMYKIGVNRPPLKYAHIPESTKDFIKNIAKNGDEGLSYEDEGPFDWDEDENLGEQADQEWAKEYDDNFIVYYHKDMNAQWQLYAQQVLESANSNIAGLTDLMGRYYYAEDMNGRKLAIYLPETKELYANTVSALMNGHSKGTGSIGITITQVGPLGCMTKGIVLHPDCFKDDVNGINGYKKTLMHEMNHYVFFSSLDYSKDIKHYLWVSEGIAEYYCQRHDRHQVTGNDSIEFVNKQCALNGEFPLSGNSAYWAGESFYLFLEGQKGIKGVQQFINTAYSTTSDSVFIKQNISVDQEHQKWVKSLCKNNE